MHFKTFEILLFLLENQLYISYTSKKPKRFLLQ